jgi:hypothetical protein
MNYFDKLPTITYDNKIAVNILARAQLSDSIKNNATVYLPYTMDDGDRVDLVSRAYYGSPGYSWLVWFSNEVVDPYYDLVVPDLDLDELIVSKYSSIELAQRKIAFYRTNGITRSEDRITIAEYNSLTNNRQKYWEPILDYLFNVKEYKRVSYAQTINTNRIGSITFANATGQFKVGEEIQYNSTNYAFCTYASDTELTVQHITGEFTADTIITGKESGATATIVTCNNAISTTLAYTDSLYWEAVSYYDFEKEENEKKREVYLVDSRLRNQIEQDLKRVMDPR